MKILAFESSCDETAVAVVEDGRRVLSDAIASQADLHALYGGVVPEIASRKHVEAIAALTEKALADAGCTRSDIDAVAVTYAPGLIGAVLVGLSFAKSVAYGLGVPLIPVHHIRGHIAANYLAFPELEPPFLALAISGGNTLIVDVRDYTDMVILGATRDDAAGECFDKAARVLGLPYPGGAPMDKLARGGKSGVYQLPHAHVDGAPLDMSFSGLKTAVVNLAHHADQVGEELDRAALARDFAQAVSDTLVPRAMEALRRTGYKTMAAAGGVAANSIIRGDLERACASAGCRLYLPPLKLCGDNGAMIGAQGYYEYLAGNTAGMELNAYATRDIAE
ncbi:tRNA (adenosine(37)-N6)-threonylcarbamoyltransferase complex transferase subunit TsaD [Dysosmobacter sp.]|uniref:tRNA (adenosine(37)-N6)-threonylcarbamoyltransferase complex transferase subunit TsaD n=1 Tax=Dysosmobacter sp. TaxID=2591382 RepID=UPI002A9D93B2|nr:tRNA (adenosine(37)-N6)-threonylcarbamoyltransferase complex transferase subunit TsaD [Dysosmobacter sp.]MDY5611735.1 tRNA (adenosine(37)-N6)-threonylcarbamoyltransferase complex transferase subunit TsaD [Dysosmobacter sp.]